MDNIAVGANAVGANAVGANAQAQQQQGANTQAHGVLQHQSSPIQAQQIQSEQHPQNANIIIQNDSSDIHTELNNIINTIFANQLNDENKELNNTVKKNKKIIKKIRQIQENLKRKEFGCEEKDKFVVPSKEDFLLSKNKYNIIQLKDICKHYKQKISGNKKDLIERITNHFKKSECIYVIQRLCRRFLYKKYKKLHGPARMNRALCVNETDFYTMEPIKDIQYNQFFSFKDKDGIIYGFDILSLYTLLTTDTSSGIKNPYNRNPLPNTLLRDLKKIVSLSKMLKFTVSITCEDEVKEVVCPRKQLEMSCISLFQYINQLGNYSDPNWFWTLDNRQIIRFLHELNDIWCYRTQLTHQMKRDICPPIGNPFMSVHLGMLSPQLPSFELKRIALNVIELIVKRGISEPNRALGATYVLCALTLVNAQAAAAMSWLYESVAH